jgi:hypothetical protein
MLLWLGPTTIQSIEKKRISSVSNPTTVAFKTKSTNTWG